MASPSAKQLAYRGIVSGNAQCMAYRGMVCNLVLSLWQNSIRFTVYVSKKLRFEVEI